MEFTNMEGEKSSAKHTFGEEKRRSKWTFNEVNVKNLQWANLHFYVWHENKQPRKKFGKNFSTHTTITTITHNCCLSLSALAEFFNHFEDFLLCFASRIVNHFFPLAYWETLLYAVHKIDDHIVFFFVWIINYFISTF